MAAPHGRNADISLSGRALTHSDIMLLSHPPDGNHITASTWLLSSPGRAPSVSNHLLHSPTQPIVQRSAPHASNLPLSIHGSGPSLFVSPDVNHLFTCPSFTSTASCPCSARHQNNNCLTSRLEGPKSSLHKNAILAVLAAFWNELQGGVRADISVSVFACQFTLGSTKYLATVNG